MPLWLATSRFPQHLDLSSRAVNYKTREEREEWEQSLGFSFKWAIFFRTRVIKPTKLLNVFKKKQFIRAKNCYHIELP